MLEKSFSVSISFRMFTDWRFFKHARNSCAEKGLNEMAVAGFGKVKYLHLLLLSVFLCKRLRFLSVPIQQFVVAEVSQAYLKKSIQIARSKSLSLSGLDANFSIKTNAAWQVRK